MESNQGFTINGISILPGSRTTINIPVARLYTHADITMPLYVIRGKKEGPVLFVSAAVHGDEILGSEIIRRLLMNRLLKKIRGSLIAVPVVNVYGFINRSRYLPDRRDLNRFFPGSKSGSLASQLASIFMDEIVANSTHGIDLHTGSNHRINLPQIRASLDHEDTLNMAKSFGAPIIINSNMKDGSLRQAVTEMGIPMLLYESGEALRYDENAIKAGIRGIISVMRYIGMIQEPKGGKREKVGPIIARSSYWVRAELSGIFNTRIKLGDMISKGDVMGMISDPFGDTIETIYSRYAGVVIGQTRLPLVYKGDALFNIAGLGEYEGEREPVENIYDYYENNGKYYM
jgi:predicted deacylase